MSDVSDPSGGRAQVSHDARQTTGLMKPAAAARSLGISTDQLLALTRAGELPYVNVGLGTKRESRRYEPDDVAAFKLARRRIKALSPPPVTPRKRRAADTGLTLVDFKELLEHRRATKRKATR